MNDPKLRPAAKSPPSGIEEIVPPHPAASPSQLGRASGAGVPFWLPGWRDSLRYLGWRWVLAIPLIAVICLGVAGVIEPRRWAMLWYIGFKPLVIIVAGPALLMARLAKTAIKVRKEPFCIHCGYDLSGLADNYNCPECGRPYTFAMIDEYRRDPHWFARRWKAQHEIPRADVPFTAGKSTRRRSRDGT